MDIGLRLKIVRETAGLSQRALAKRAGITNSTVCLIEGNKTNPSVGALKRVLDAIPIGMAEFFAFEPEVGEQIFFRADELREIGKGPVSYKQVGRLHTGARLQLLSECYQPGADSGRVLLSHEGEEGGIVISGRLEVSVDSHTKILGPGDAYLFDSRRPHRFRCIGTTPAKVVSACTPPTF